MHHRRRPTEPVASASTRVDAPKLGPEAYAVLGHEPAHVLDMGTRDVNRSVRPFGETVGPAEPLVLDKGGDGLAVPHLQGILLDSAEIELPALVHPKAVRGLGLGDAFDAGSDIGRR